MASQWYYKAVVGQVGPVSSAELRDLAQRGAILPSTLVATEPNGDWVRAERVQGLFPDFRVGPPQLPAPPPQPTRREATANGSRIVVLLCVGFSIFGLCAALVLKAWTPGRAVSRTDTKAVQVQPVPSAAVAPLPPQPELAPQEPELAPPQPKLVPREPELAPQEPLPYEFRGDRLGMTFAEFRARHEASSFEFSDVLPDTLGVVRAKFKSPSGIGDLKQLCPPTYEFIDDRLWKIQMQFEQYAYSDIHDVLLEKYGQPAPQRVELADEPLRAKSDLYDLANWSNGVSRIELLRSRVVAEAPTVLTFQHNELTRLWYDRFVGMRDRHRKQMAKQRAKDL